MRRSLRFGGARARPRPARDGFTLVETAVVLAILAGAMLVVAPLLRLPEPAPDVPQLQVVMSAARREAIVRGEVVELVVAPTSGRYWLLDAQWREIATGTVVDAEPRAAASDEPLRIRFQPSGSAEPLPASPS